MSDIRTEAIVLRRTNYGEADRIINFITPSGKISALARSVRKEKSRLAGGIELFTVADIVVHQGRSELGTLTGAKMLRFYRGIMESLPRLELASNMLKKIDRAAEQTDNPEYFSLLDQSLAGLGRGLPVELITTWFYLNLARAGGEEINLVRDVGGGELSSEQAYVWDFAEEALRPDLDGPITAREIKFARLLLSSRLAAATKVNDFEKYLAPLFPLIGKYK